MDTAKRRQRALGEAHARLRQGSYSRLCPGKSTSRNATAARRAAFSVAFSFSKVWPIQTKARCIFEKDRLFQGENVAKKVIEYARLMWRAYKKASEQGWGLLRERQRALTVCTLSDLLAYSERQVRRMVAALMDAGLMTRLSKRRGYVLNLELLTQVLGG